MATDMNNELLGKDVNSLSPAQAVEWARQIYESGAGPAYEATWKYHSQGSGNVPNLYRSQYYDAYKTFKETVGRDPNANEFGQIYPAFVGQADRNTGVQLVSAIASQEENKPVNLGKRAPQYADQVSSVFKSTMGRAPTADELDYFGKQLATGEVGSYELGNFLKNTQEYQDAADTKFRSSVGQELIPQQEEVFNKAKESIVARYNRMGTQNSPALDFALTNMLGELEKGRQGFLTNLKTSQYSGNKEAARADYGSQLQNYLNTVNAQRGQNQNMVNSLNQRSWDQLDYQRQMNDYLNALNSQGGGRRSSMGSAIGPLAGMGIGALLAAPTGGMSIPMGAMLGGSMGSAGGGAFDYFNSRGGY